MSAPLRLLLYAHWAGSAGAERSLLELADELTTDHAVACTVVVPFAGPLHAQLNQRGIATLIVPCGWWCRGSWSLKESVEVMRRALDANSRLGHFDLVMTITSAIPWGAITAAHFRLPHVWYVHETGQNLPFVLPVETVRGIIDESSNHILAVSHATRAVFERVPDARITVVSPAVRLPPPGPVANVAARPPGRCRLIITGTVTPHKGQEDAIRALPILLAAGRDVDLLVIGPAEPGEICRLRAIAEEQGVSERTHFLGFRDDIAGLVANADVALVCSRNTALDRVSIEAMLLRTPLVAARSGGAIELCQDGRHGLHYTPGDAAELAAAIDEVLTNRVATASRVRRAYDYANQTFTRDAHGGAVFRLISNLSGTANPTYVGWSDSTLDLLARAATATKSPPVARSAVR